MHRLFNIPSRVIHLIEGTIHNLKKFFAFGRRKYTLLVYKDLQLNILLSKKENLPVSRKKFPPFFCGGMIKIDETGLISYFQLLLFLVFQQIAEPASLPAFELFERAVPYSGYGQLSDDRLSGPG
jgi:hypothetical protein